MPPSVAVLPTPSVWRGVRLKDFEDAYLAAGLVVEVEAGPIGVVVYGASKHVVSTVATHLAESARARDPRAEVEFIGTDEGEPAETRWHAVVTFNWATMGSAT